MASKIEQTAFEVGDVIAKEQGVFLLHTEFKKESGESYLRLFIDKEGGVGIEECENFSRAFSDKIDELDPIEEAYVLEVSSPGADRKLTTEREFIHYIGRKVDVKLYAARDGKKEITGILKGYEDGTALIDAGGEVFEISKKEAVYIRLSFEF